MKSYILIAVLLNFTVNAFAETLNGRVIGVSDGDTLTLLSDNKQIKVRLNAIDAPESKQAFGNKSKQSLVLLCKGKAATVETLGLDQYGRTIGNVICQGESANAHQVANGSAWVYRKYSNDGDLIALEQEAKDNRIGLWDAPSPIAPWDFRHGVKAETFDEAQSKVKLTHKAGGKFSCEGKYYCREMASCDEAKFYLNECGVDRLDRDHDGVPCESICGG